MYTLYTYILVLILVIIKLVDFIIPVHVHTTVMIVVPSTCTCTHYSNDVLSKKMALHQAQGMNVVKKKKHKKLCLNLLGTTGNRRLYYD